MIQCAPLCFGVKLSSGGWGVYGEGAGMACVSVGGVGRECVT